MAIVGLPYCTHGYSYGVPTTACSKHGGEFHTQFIIPSSGKAHLVHGLESFTERALADARLWEVRLPQQVGVAEHQLDRGAATISGTGIRGLLRVGWGPLAVRQRLLIWGGGRVEVRAADDAARTDDVEDDLDVERPVPRVVEDEDRRKRDV